MSCVKQNLNKQQHFQHIVNPCRRRSKETTTKKCSPQRHRGHGEIKPQDQREPNETTRGEKVSNEGETAGSHPAADSGDSASDLHIGFALLPSFFRSTLSPRPCAQTFTLRLALFHTCSSFFRLSLREKADAALPLLLDGTAEAEVVDEDQTCSAGGWGGLVADADRHLLDAGQVHARQVCLRDRP